MLDDAPFVTRGVGLEFVRYYSDSLTKGTTTYSHVGVHVVTVVYGQSLAISDKVHTTFVHIDIEELFMWKGGGIEVLHKPEWQRKMVVISFQLGLTWQNVSS